MTTYILILLLLPFVALAVGGTVVILNDMVKEMVEVWRTTKDK